MQFKIVYMTKTLSRYLQNLKYCHAYDLGRPKMALKLAITIFSYTPVLAKFCTHIITKNKLFSSVWIISDIFFDIWIDFRCLKGEWKSRFFYVGLKKAWKKAKGIEPFSWDLRYLFPSTILESCENFRSIRSVVLSGELLNCRLNIFVLFYIWQFHLKLCITVFRLFWKNYLTDWSEIFTGLQNCT